MEIAHGTDTPVVPWGVAVHGYAHDAQEAVLQALADEWNSEEDPEETWGQTLADYGNVEWQRQDEGRFVGYNEATDRDFYLTAARVA